MDPKAKPPRTERLKRWEIALVAGAGLLFSTSLGAYLSGIPLRKYLLGISDGMGEDKIGTLAARSGTVRREVSGESDFRNIEARDTLYMRDTLMTSADGSATVRLDDGSQIELGPKTMVKLETVSYLSLGGVARNTRIEVVSGEVTGKSGGSGNVVIAGDQGEVILGKDGSRTVKAAEDTPEKALERARRARDAAPGLLSKLSLGNLLENMVNTRKDPGPGGLNGATGPAPASALEVPRARDSQQIASLRASALPLPMRKRRPSEPPPVAPPSPSPLPARPPAPKPIHTRAPVKRAAPRPLPKATVAPRPSPSPSPSPPPSPKPVAPPKPTPKPEPLAVTIALKEPAANAALEVAKDSPKAERPVHFAWELTPPAKGGVQPSGLPLPNTVFTVYRLGAEADMRTPVETKSIPSHLGRNDYDWTTTSPGNFAWEVKIDKDASESKFSVPDTFEGLQIAPPEAIRVPKKAEAGEDWLKENRPKVKLTWPPYPGASDYVVRVFGSKDGKTSREDTVPVSEYIVAQASISESEMSYEVHSQLPNGFIVTSAKGTVLFDFTPPDAVSPLNGATLTIENDMWDENGVLITWQKTGISEGYLFELARDQDFKNVVVRREQKDNFYIYHPATVTGNQVYFWHVRAMAKGHISRPSSTFQFNLTEGE